jgi:hypothetical protein
MESVAPPIKIHEIEIFTWSSGYLLPGFLHFWILNIFIHFPDIYFTLPRFLGFGGKPKDHGQNMIYLMLFTNIVGEPFFFVTCPNSKDLKELPNKLFALDTHQSAWCEELS